MANCAVLTMSNASANVHVPFVTVQPLGKHGTKQNASGPSVWMVYVFRALSLSLSLSLSVFATFTPTTLH
jgi:hypothetical protein